MDGHCFIVDKRYQFLCHYTGKITTFRCGETEDRMKGIITITEPREWWPVGVPTSKAILYKDDKEVQYTV
ncbi:hypothetical protein AB2S62_22130 [Vibrio sp. NTOU-M3]|uniref:hypothetical protein n=1 Tax=Vibrio sp. NTOU-M3 TaxID=3234954 RepID=UPI0035A9A01D